MLQSVVKLTTSNKLILSKVKIFKSLKKYMILIKMLKQLSQKNSLKKLTLPVSKKGIGEATENLEEPDIMQTAQTHVKKELTKKTF